MMIEDMKAGILSLDMKSLLLT